MYQNNSKLSVFEKIISKIVSFLENERGTLAVPFALATVPLLLIAGSAIDYSRAASFKAKLQSIVDSSALRALETSEESWQSTTEAAVQSLGDQDPEILVSGNGDDVQVTATASIKTSVLSIVRIDRIPVTVKSRAQISNRLPACLLALNPEESGAISFSGASGFFARGCVVHANSKNASGLDISNNSSPIAAGFCSAGGVKAPAGIAPSPRSNCRTIRDPFEKLPKPVGDRCVGKGNSGHVVGSNQTETLSPGTYCGGLDIRGNATLNPGVYILDGGSFTINAQATVLGRGVTIFLTGSSGGFTFNGGASIELHAPTTGTLGGIVLFQDPLSGGRNNQRSTLNGGSGTIINGAIYMPAHAITINGSGEFGQYSDYMPVIADTISLSGSSKINVDVDEIEMAAPLPMSTETRIVE